MTTAIYPGSFDPFTNGHLDITRRASKLFEHVIVGVYATPAKNILFTVEERLELIKQSVAELPNVTAQSYTGLTTEFAKEVGAQAMVRGLRMTLDFIGEFDMAMMNKKLYPELESVFFMANQGYQFLSSTLMKEVANLGGDINEFVPPPVAKALLQKFRQ